MTTVQHLQNLRSEFSRLASCEYEKADTDTSSVNQFKFIVRGNAYSNALHMVEKAIFDIEHDQIAPLTEQVSV